MTISSSVARVTFNCDGSTQTFPVPMQAYLATDFLVIHNSTALVLNSDYTMVASGTLNPQLWSMSTTLVYPATDKLQVILNPTQTQLTQYVTNQAFPSPAVQANVDRLTQMVIRLQDKLSRAVIAPDIDVSPAVQLPAASARANTYQGYDANGNLLLFNLLLSGAVLSTATLAPFLGLSITAQEIAAGVVPVNSAYPELDVRRYGAFPGNSAAQNTTAIQSGISVLAQHQYGELLIPQGLTLNVTQVNFAAMSQFNLRCDGVLNSSAAAAGTPFANVTASQGFFSPIRMTNCTQFKICGEGCINPGFVDAIWIQSCSDFDISLDLRGTGKNSNMRGVLIEACFQFRIHDMTVDSITAQAMTDGSETYFNFLDSVAIFSCYDFKIDHCMVRRSGANGIYILAVGFGGNFNTCHDFEITNNICEFNAESGIQLTFAGGSTCPINYKVNDNILRYNQADGIDAANTSNILTNIFATFNNNLHIYNGYANCNPNNSFNGADGSGIGTFAYLSEFQAVGNVVFESHNSSIFLSHCSDWHIANNTVLRDNPNINLSQGTVAIDTSPVGTLTDNDITSTGGAAAVVFQPCLNIIMSGNNINGVVSLASGAWGNSKFKDNTVTSPTVINWPMDFIDNSITITGVGQQGIVAAADNLNAVRNVINSSGTAINTNTHNYASIQDNTTTVSTSVAGILINSSNGCTVTGNNSTATSGAAIQFQGTCTGGVLASNQGSGGNSFSTSSGTTQLSKYGNVSIAGTTSYADTSPQINFP